MSIDLILQTVEGWLFEGEARMLNRRAAEVAPPLCVVEIGSYRGRSTCALAHNLQPGVEMFAIDPHQLSDGVPFGDEDRRIWTENVHRLTLSGRVKPINLSSLDVAKIWNKPIGLIFVDGDHAAVAADLDAWLPHVADGGMVATHDSNGPAIILAVSSRSDIVEIERSDITVVYRKEPLYEPFTYDNLTLLVRKGPYNKDDRYVLSEVRSYDIGSAPIRTCIDVGCQIGAFSAWIKSLYPDAQIVGVEPETSCYLTALKNLSVPGVMVLNQRVNYDSLQQALFVDPVNAGSHRIVNREDVTPGQSVVPAPEAVTLEQIMKDQEWETLSLLKIDAEGAEQDILMNCSADVLRKTRRVVGEFHTNFGSPIEPIAARLEALGFTVTWEKNPAAHSTFLAINQNWQEPEDEPAIEYGTVIEERKPAPKRTPPKGKKR